MEILKICSIGVVAAVLALTVRQYRPEIALIISAAAAVIILFMAADYISQAIAALADLSEKSGVSGPLLSAVIKIIGVGYVTEFSANICEDAGNKSIADKITLGGKLAILVASLPVLTAVIDLIAGMLQ
jgi:stage III sporulation protein AD